jgi:hypothetical protein
MPQEDLVTLGKEPNTLGLYSTEPPCPDLMLTGFEDTLPVQTPHIETRHLVSGHPTIL